MTISDYVRKHLNTKDPDPMQQWMGRGRNAHVWITKGGNSPRGVAENRRVRIFVGGDERTGRSVSRRFSAGIRRGSQSGLRRSRIDWISKQIPITILTANLQGKLPNRTEVQTGVSKLTVHPTEANK